MKSRQAWLLVCAIAYATLVSLTTGTIQGSGRWYSDDVVLRQQVESILRGTLALSTSPADLVHNLAWSNGGVQQVSGLGVPMWRLPFEVLARMTGCTGFPDRLAYAIALAVFACAVISTFFDRWDRPDLDPTKSCSPLILDITGGLACGVVLLFPPFLSLHMTLFDVYEEVVAYGYIIICLTGVVLIRYIRRPTSRLFVLLCCIAGFAPWIRPTAIFYSLSALAVAAGVHRWPSYPPATAAEKVTRPALLLGLGCFVVLISGLLATNHARFGAALEFGHKLNVQHYFGSMYSTRFAAPIEEQSQVAALLELGGFMFGSSHKDNCEFYQQNLVPFQTPAVRFRELYFPTFDLSYAAGALLVMTLAALSQVREAKLLVAWALMALIACAMFYARCPVISSRYILDFAPAFAGLAVAGISIVAAGREVHTHKVSSLKFTCCFGCAAWMIWQISSAGSLQSANAVSVEAVRSAMQPTVLAKLPDLPAEYRSGITLPDLWPESSGTSRESHNILHSFYGYGFNGSGWNPRDGSTRPVVILFGQDISGLEIELETNDRVALEEIDIAAKVGLERLWKSRCTVEGSRLTVQFDGPRSPKYGRGVQIVFLGLGPPSQLNASATSYRLLRVSFQRHPDAGREPSTR